MRPRHYRPRPQGGTLHRVDLRRPGRDLLGDHRGVRRGGHLLSATPGSGSRSSSITYFVGYMLTFFIFALVGEARRRKWEERDWTERRGRGGPFGFAPADVHHAVIVPNYKEPLAVLERSIAGVRRAASRDRAHRSRAGDGRARTGRRSKGRRRWPSGSRAAFERVIVTVHPGGVPGELACKGSNQTYAASRRAG